MTSFTFSLFWFFYSPSYIISTIYHINCLQMSKMSITLSDLTSVDNICKQYLLIKKLTNTSNLCLCMPTKFNSNVNHFTLIVKMEGIHQTTNQRIGKLTLRTNPRKRFCVGPRIEKHPWMDHLQFMTAEAHTKEILCMEYIADYDLYTTYFDRFNKYDIHLQLYEWPKVILFYRFIL